MVNSGDIILLALQNGVSKQSNKPWFKVTLKGHKDDGSPIIREHFISASVAQPLLAAGAVEDVPVEVDCRLDEYLNPHICAIRPLDA